MKRLLVLAKFSSPHHMERLIVECARNNDMQVRLDHRTGSVNFGTDLSEAQRTDLTEGPNIQAMPSEQVGGSSVDFPSTTKHQCGCTVLPLCSPCGRSQVYSQRNSELRLGRSF